MPDLLVATLESVQAQQAIWKSKIGPEFNQYNLVCLNTRLEMWKMNTLFRQFARFCNRYDLRRIRMYDLRHSSATLSIAAGTDIKTVSTRLGHSDIRTTMRYSHINIPILKKVIATME